MNKKLFSILFLFSFSYHFINMVKNSVLKYLGIQHLETSWFKLLLDVFIIELVFGMLLIVFLIFISKKMMTKAYSWFTVISVHFILYLVSLLITYFIYYFYLLSIKAPEGEGSFTYHIVNITYYLNIHFLIYFVNIFIIYTYYYLEKISKIELNRSNLREQLVKVKVNILKYKLHPHFFFNTLNTITNLITTDTKLAQKTLVDFSGLLRDILYLKDSNLLTLSEEVAILRKYLDILSVRFSEDLTIKMNIEDGLENALIPSLILQPIIENSIMHGYSYNHTTLKMCLEISSYDRRLICQVSNDGQRVDEDNIQYGNGLQNTIDRLMTLFDDNYGFSIKNRPDNRGVITELQFPLEFVDSNNEELSSF